MEKQEQLQQYIKDIEAWEKNQEGLFFWEKLGRIPFKLLDRFTPKFIQEKLARMIAELGKYVQNGGRYLVSEKTMLANIAMETGADIKSVEDVAKLPIEDIIKLSEKLAKGRVKFATVQGASTGIGGIFTLAIDIPALVGTALKTLQEIAILHGYDPNDVNERVFIVKCLQFASSDVVGKEAILNELKALHVGNDGKKEMMSQLKGWQEVFFTYRDHYGWKKLFQMVPIVGIVFAAFANRGMIEDIAEAGIMLYRKRRVYEKLGELTQTENGAGN